jgi:hypothetical protein
MEKGSIRARMACLYSRRWRLKAGGGSRRVHDGFGSKHDMLLRIVLPKAGLHGGEFQNDPRNVPPVCSKANLTSTLPFSRGVALTHLKRIVTSSRPLLHFRSILKTEQISSNAFQIPPPPPSAFRSLSETHRFSPCLVMFQFQTQRWTPSPTPASAFTVVKETRFV